jgi:hypothetical protein
MNSIIEFNFTASDPLHIAFLKWKETASSNDLLNAILCGYSIISSDILSKYVKSESESETYEDLKSNHEEIISIMKINYEEVIANIKRQYSKENDDYINRLKLQHLKEREEYITHFRNETRQQCEQWVSKYENMSKEYNDYIKGNLESTKDKEINELKAQLTVLQNSNIYKGDIGELQIKDILTRNFLGYEIKDTSSDVSMSDIHLVDKDGYIIVIESKNKAIITALDISKSINDIKNIKNKFGDKFIGYLFTSIRSNNIPKKGDLYFEMIDDIPTIWYGTNKTTLMLEHDLIRLIKLLFMHRSYQINTDTTSSHINEYMRKITEIKKQMDQMNHSITSLKTNLQSMQSVIEWLYNDMVQLVGNQVAQYICPQCNVVYKRKGDLERHIKSKHI